MKILNKTMISVLCSSLLAAGPVRFINPTNSYAAESDVENNTGFNVENSTSTANTHNFSLVNPDTNIDVDIKYTDNTVTVTTITNGAEEHTFTYNQSNGFALLDGKIMNLEINEPDFVIDSEETLSPQISLFATPSDKPVFVSPGNISFSESVDSVGKVVAVITGAVVLAKMIGVTLPKKLIETKVQDALTLIGLGSAIALNTMSGSFTYGLYRTKDKFYTGYPGSVNSYQYKFRYQDMAVNASLLGKTMNINFSEVGSWWFQSKPM
ncbi:hypothetical protein [Lysinibacillus xylanilyticus]|uniref:hypothetical protein n=1 Tax=Lysinibacillus xylanilyticus TaxID=582475 RepID=UPI003D083334